MDLVHQDRELDGNVGRRVASDGAGSGLAGLPTCGEARALGVESAAAAQAADDSVLCAVGMADTAGFWITPGGAMECGLVVATVASGVANYLPRPARRSDPSHHQVEVLNY